MAYIIIIFPFLTTNNSYKIVQRCTRLQGPRIREPFGCEAYFWQVSVKTSYTPQGYTQGCDRYNYFGSPNQIQNPIRLVLLVLTDTKIRYHYGKMANFVSPNQIQIQIWLVLMVRPDAYDDTSRFSSVCCPQGCDGYKYF